MLDRELVRRTEAFLREKFDGALYLSAHPEAKSYRLEHTFRVARIGREIALREGFDETEMVIACLLHDVSYCEEFGENGWREHGRRSAVIARPFLRELGLPEERIADICYGIAIHVDDEADFEGERTDFALSVGDADNVDRFDAYRIHELLERDGFLHMSLEEKEKYVQERLVRLRQAMEIPLGTRTAEELWRGRLAFYREFLGKLADQLRCSRSLAD